MGQSVNKDDYVETRRAICKACEHRANKFAINYCSLCNCPIYTKTLVKSTECPIKKWEKIE